MMSPPKLSPESIIGNTLAVSAGAIMILRPPYFLLAPCWPPGFLTARCGSTLFLAVRFLLRWLHVSARLLLRLLLFLLGSRRLGFVLPWRFHFILSRGRLGFILLRFGTRLVLLRRLLLPLGLFLLRFFFLLFVVLRVNHRRTRKQSRENS